MKRLPWESSFRVSVLCVMSALCALLLAAPAAQAEYISGFEGLSGSSAGVPLTGQDGYYIPPGTSSVDFLVYTYAGNLLGLPPNPTGGDQFIGGTGPAGSTYARAQRDLSFAGGNVWVLGYDFAAAFLGTGASANNIGSFSIRNEATGVTHYIHLMSWVNPDDPTGYNAFYMAYDAGGTQFTQPGTSPGAEWENLELGHWYRGWTVIDLESNMFLEVGIIDLETMAEAIYSPSDWYLEGGAGGTSAVPDCFRFFAGGSVEGNSLAFDNIAIEWQITSIISTTWGGIKSLY